MLKITEMIVTLYKQLATATANCVQTTTTGCSVKDTLVSTSTEFVETASTNKYYVYCNNRFREVHLDHVAYTEKTFKKVFGWVFANPRHETAIQRPEDYICIGQITMT
jgi:hypothetical protein